MPKKGRTAVRSRSQSASRKRRIGRPDRDDWVQYALMVAQMASSIAALIQAVKH
jgi:hypothetical protein